MSYASLADMQDMFGDAELIQLTDRAGNGTLDTALVQVALDDASAEADSYLPLPPDLPNRALVRHTAAIARFLLYKDAATDEVRERYQDAIAWLRLAAAGKVVAGTSASGTPAAMAMAGSLSLPHEARKVWR